MDRPSVAMFHSNWKTKMVVCRWIITEIGLILMKIDDGRDLERDEVQLSGEL